MENTTILYIYVFGWLVWSGVLVEKITFRDILASMIAGLGWPVGVPIRILKKCLG